MVEQIAVVAVPGRDGKFAGKEPGDVIGYYGHRRIRVGDKFVIDRRDFPPGPEGDKKFEAALSPNWMQRLTEKEAKAVDEELKDKRAEQRRKRPTETVI